MSKYNTEQRKILISYFESLNHKTVSASDVYTNLKDKGISKSAIYRNLSEMESDGLLCKITEKNRSSALYQYVDPHNCIGVIHLKCQSCDATFHLNKHISQMIIGISKDDFSFKVNDSAAFLYGQCENCSQKSM